MAGVMLRKGEGCKEDQKAAFAMNSRAVEQGHVEAQFNAGLMLGEGLGCTQSDSKSTEMYRLAAKQGHSGAQFNYGNALFYGTGVNKNMEAGKAIMKVSADEGDLHAKAALASIEATEAINAGARGESGSMATNAALKKATRAARANIEENGNSAGLEKHLALMRDKRVCSVCGASPHKDPSVKIVFCKACNLK